MKRLVLSVFAFVWTVLVIGQTLSVSSEQVISDAGNYSGYDALSWGDITGIGKLDIVSEASGSSAYLLGITKDLRGTPEFALQNHIAKEANNIYGSCLGDLDGDGDLDFVTAGPNGATTSPNNIYCWDSSTETYLKVGSAYSLKGEAFYGASVVIGDFTGDSKNDVVWLAGGGRIYVGVNSTTEVDNITFSSITEQSLGNSFSIGYAASQVGDFNNDGNLDIATPNDADGGTYRLLLGNGDGTFTASVDALAADVMHGISVAVGDINQDGQLDMALVRSSFTYPDYSQSSSELVLYIRNDVNTGWDEDHIFSLTGGYSKQVVVDDVNNDSYPDLLFKTESGNKLVLFLNNGDGSFNEIPDLSFDTPSGLVLFYISNIDNVGYKEITVVTTSKVLYYKVGYEPEIPVANDNTVTYDGEEHTASASVSGGASLIWYTTETGSIKTVAPTATNAGVYIGYAASKNPSGFESSSRTLVTLTINKKDLSVIDAVAASKVYDGTLEAVVSGASILGIVGSDEVIMEDATVGEFASKDVSDDVVVNTVISVSGSSATNYSVVQSVLSANITPKNLEITADAETKSMGEADPELTYSITDGELLLGDDFTGGLSREEGESIGVYAIELGDLSAGGNYSISLVSATFTIDMATNITEFSKSNINVYPNPVSEYVNIISSKDIKRIELYNSNSQMVKDIIAIGKSVRFVAFDLVPGIYFLKIYTDNGVDSALFIKP